MAVCHLRVPATGRRIAPAGLALLLVCAGAAHAVDDAPPAAGYVPVPATSFSSVIESEPGTPPEAIAAYSMRAAPSMPGCGAGSASSSAATAYAPSP